MIKLLKIAPFLLLTGCTAVGPDWKAPSTQLANTFVSGDSKTINEVAYRPWWREFNDQC